MSEITSKGLSLKFEKPKIGLESGSQSFFERLKDVFARLNLDSDDAALIQITPEIPIDETAVNYAVNLTSQQDEALTILSDILAAQQTLIDSLSDPLANTETQTLVANEVDALSEEYNRVFESIYGASQNASISISGSTIAFSFDLGGLGSNTYSVNSSTISLTGGTTAQTALVNSTSSTSEALASGGGAATAVGVAAGSTETTGTIVAGTTTTTQDVDAGTFSTQALTGTTTTSQSLASGTKTVSAADPDLDTVTITGHGYSTGDSITISGSGFFAGGFSSQTFYVIVDDANTVRLALTQDGAVYNNEFVDIEANGTGTSVRNERLIADISSGQLDDVANTLSIGGHGLTTGDRVTISSSQGIGMDLPGELSVALYAIVDDANTIRFAASQADALANTEIDFGGGASGTFYVGAYINNSNVNVATDAITAASHGLATGDRIRFSATDLPNGLSAGTDYYAIVDDANTIRVATSRANALADTDIDITLQGSNNLSITKYVGSFNSGTDTILSPGHGLISGQRVSFTGAGVPTGLSADTDYYAIITDSGAFKVATSFENALAGTSVNFTTEGSGAITLNYYAENNSYQEIDSVNFDRFSGSLFLEDHGLVTGQQVSFDGFSPPELAPGSTYYVIKLDDDNVQFTTSYQNALDGVFIEFTDPSAGTAKLYIDQTVFSAGTDAVLADAHGLVTGQRIQFSGTGTPGAGVSEATDYYAIVDTSGSFRIATSYANALAGTAVNITSAGSGDLTITKYLNNFSSDSEQITVTSHGFSTGQEISFAGAGVPSGLSASTTYYAIVDDSNRFRLAATLADALDDLEINITGVGSGTIDYTAGAKNIGVDDTDINTGTDRITYSSHGLSTGDLISFSQIGAGALPGGLNADYYYAIRIDANTLKLAATREDAGNGIGIDITSTGTGRFAIQDPAFEISVANNSVTLKDHGLINGQRVQLSGTILADIAPGGLSLDTDYYAIVVDENTIKFATSEANALLNSAINLTSAGSGSLTLTGFAGGSFDAATDVVTQEDHNLVNGQRIRFAGTGVAPSGLSKFVDYYAIVGADPDTFKVATSEANALLGTSINFTDIGSGSVSLISYTDSYAFDGSSNEVTTPGAHGFSTGQRVQFTGSGTLPTELSKNTEYYAIQTGATTFKLATTLSNALSNTFIDFSGSASGDITLTSIGSSNFDNTTDTISATNHGLSTGQTVRLSASGSLPSGLDPDTTYYAIRVSANSLKLATSLPNATSGSAIDFISNGVSDITITAFNETRISSGGSQGSFDLSTTNGILSAAATIADLSNRLAGQIGTVSANQTRFASVKSKASSYGASGASSTRRISL